LERSFPSDGIVVVCDPNNPTGVKLNDEDLFKNLTGITSIGTTVIFDSPYRRMRRDRSDDFFRRISRMPNIVIVESFSKSLGMPGMRIAFLRSSDKELMKAVRTRLTYGFSGVNMFAQQVVEYLLTNPDGQQIVTEFKEQTNTEIIKNIQWLSVHGLLEQSLYTDTPDGIFAIVNKSEEEMIANRIGAVSLDFFTELPELRERYANASRICVSVPHTRFVKFFSRLTL
jgi:aspartate/methionine/tyrosine aminotransferase